ncbi:MAG: 50S ribosomal protein L15 [Deltaproteobacteria bacterium]|nr:50S ribosomal protein L15 [Deltaproteobacteria bacterium]
MSILSRLKPPAGAVRARSRIGRGPGSGKGKTCGRGQKGQGARTGFRGRQYFEGGQMPLQRRLPKRGFHNTAARVVAYVNVGVLEDAFGDGAQVTIEALRELRLVKGQFDAVKVLGGGELGKKLTVLAHAFTHSAVEKIARAGGSAVVLGAAPARPDSGADGRA